MIFVLGYKSDCHSMIMFQVQTAPLQLCGCISLVLNDLVFGFRLWGKENQLLWENSELMETDWVKAKDYSVCGPQKTPSASKWLNIPPLNARSKSSAPRQQLQQKSISIFRTRDLIKTGLFPPPWMFRRNTHYEKSLKGTTNNPHVKIVSIHFVPFSDVVFLRVRVD